MATWSSPDMSPADIANALSGATFPDGSVATLIETHWSWVFLSRSRAYKLRKLTDAGKSVSERLEARRCASARELKLNLRLAPSVYLGVVPVTASPAGLCVGGTGAVVDWLLEMRRLPRELMLDVRIAEHTVGAADCEALAVTLASFYQRCDPAPLGASEYRSRLVTEMRAKASSLEAPEYGLSRELVRSVFERQRAWLSEHADLVGARGAAVVDAHGDLRPEHVCLEQPPVVIDCLELDRSLRLLDPVSELSYLYLECRRLGAGWIGEQVLARRAALAGDPVPRELVDFYQGFHALIRAALAAWHLDEAPEQAARWQARAHHYLHLAADAAAEGGRIGGARAVPTSRPA